MILHIEINDFLIAAAEQCHPYLRGRPFVIAPLGADRARVFAASPVARAMGIRRGMFLRDAQKIERKLVVHPMEARFYAAISGEVVKVLSAYSPVIEPWRYGQVYLEMFERGENWQRLRDVAYRLQKDVTRRLALTPAVGMGTNKLISRAASHRGVRHHEILWVPPGHERPFLAPFAVNFLPHVDRRIAAELHNLNIWQVRELAGLSRLQLQELFGRVGWRLYDEARGIDPTPVMPPEKRQGLYEEWRFVPETNDAEKIHSAGYTLLNRLSRYLRETRMAAGRLALSATYADGRFFTRWRNVPAPAAREDQLLPTLQELLHRLLARRVALCRMGIRLLHLQPATQLDLFAPEVPEKQVRLATALDAIKGRYGEQAIVLGKQLSVLVRERGETLAKAKKK